MKTNKILIVSFLVLLAIGLLLGTQIPELRKTLKGRERAISIASTDGSHLGEFWDGMREAGFKCLATTEKQGVHAEIWNIRVWEDVLQVGWIFWFVGDTREKITTFSPGVDGGCLIYSGGRIEQYSCGSLDTFSLSDRMEVYTWPISRKLKPPNGILILTQGFKMPPRLVGPLTIVHMIELNYSNRQEIVELKGENIPLSAIEKKVSRK